MKDRKYIEQKHNSLNTYSSKYGSDLLEIMQKQFDILTEDIRVKEKRLSRVRRAFVYVFVFGMLAAGITGIVLGLLDANNIADLGKDIGYAGGAATAELAVYQAIVHPMRDSVTALENKRDVIKTEIISASKNISISLLKEQEALTKYLVETDTKKK